MQNKFRFMGILILLSMLLTAVSQEATIKVNLGEVYTLEEISIFNNFDTESTNMEMKNNIAYFTTGIGGVKIVNMSEIVEPQEISTFVEFGNLGQIVMDVDLYGNDRMVVYTTVGNFYIADITDLNLIFQMNDYSWYSGVPYSDVIKMRHMIQNNLYAIEGSTFYVYTLNAAGGFDLYANVLGTENGFSDVTGMYVSADSAFVSSSTGFQWYQLSDTFSEITLLESVDGLSISQKHNSFGNLYVNHTNVFVVTGPSNAADVTIFDIATKPIQQVGKILIGGRINEILAEGHELYIAGDNFINIYDMTMPNQPTLTYTKSIHSNPTSITVDNNDIYTTQLNNGLIVYSKDNATLATEIPSTNSLINSTETESASESFSNINITVSTEPSTLVSLADFPFLYTIISLIVILTYRRIK